MKSAKRFSKKWKWILAGASCSIVAIGALSLGIALSAQNKSLQTSSPYFIGKNSLAQMYKSLSEKGYNNTFNVSNWQTFAKDYNMSYYNGSNLSNLIDNSAFSTYRINSNDLYNLSKENLLTNTESNLESVLNSDNLKDLDMYYYTLDTASFFNSEINLFTDAVISSINQSTNGRVSLNLVSKTPTTSQAIYNSQNCELGTSFWAPDYNNVSAWIGYLFAQNSGWITGNLWPCLWALLAGANPNPSISEPGEEFVFNGQLLDDTQLGTNSYKNASTFAQQLSWTNQRRNQMGLGDLPNWAVSLYYTLYTSFGNSISWNTPYGWWQLQYNNNNLDGSLQYVIQNWASSVDNSEADITINGSSYTGNNTTDPSPSSYNNASSTIIVNNSGKAQYTSDSSLIPFLGWIDALTPTLPFYSDGNNLSQLPILSQKGVYPLLNPSNDYINSSYFVNVSGKNYSSNRPFIFYISESVVGTLNDSYFSPVLGSNAFYEFASGLYSGLLGYSPYNWSPTSSSDEADSYSSGYGITSKASEQIMKVDDANNFELLNFNSNFHGAHYNSDGTLNNGDTIITSGKDQNANILFIANPELLVNNTNNIMTESEFDAFQSSHKYTYETNGKQITWSITWSNYTSYLDFEKYHEIDTSDSNLINAIQRASAYQFVLNKNVKWVNESGNSTGSIEPDDFNNSLAWMAATMSDYSYNSSGQQLPSVQANSYMLQEMGIAGNNFDLGVGSGFFQTEEYSPNKLNNGDTFTYFLSPSTITSSEETNGWTSGNPISYFLQMLATQGSYLDPLPSNESAFWNLPSSYSNWNNITIGDLTQDFMGNSSTTGVWNLSQLLSKSTPNTSTYTKYFNELNSNPSYITLVADENLSNGFYSLDYLYGSGIDALTGLPEMQSNLLFNGGYYANAGTFTSSSLKTSIYAPYFDTAQSTTYNGQQYYFFAPSSQKLDNLEYQWSSNITREEELTLFTSNQIDYDSNITSSQLSNLSLTGNQSIYFRGISKVTGSNSTYYNAQIYNLTTEDNAYSVPQNDAGDPLIQLDNDSSSSSNTNTYEINAQEYYGVVGFPWITINGNVLYTDPADTTGSLKSYVSKSWVYVVGSVLDPFIYGTSGAEIRQDIDALINWSAIADTASSPLAQSILTPSVIPYGNYKGTFAYQVPIGNDETTTVTVPTFFQYAAATSGMGLLGTPLYYTFPDADFYYSYDYLDNSSKNIYYGYTQYQWDMINSINDWN